MLCHCACIHTCTYIIYFDAHIFYQLSQICSYGFTSLRNHEIYHSIPLLTCNTAAAVLPLPAPPLPWPTHNVVFLCHSHLLVYLKLGWKQLFVPRRRVQEQSGIEISASEITPAYSITVLLFYLFECLRLLYFSQNSSFVLCTYPLRPTRVMFQTKNSCMVRARCVIC